MWAVLRGLTRRPSWLRKEPVANHSLLRTAGDAARDDRRWSEAASLYAEYLEHEPDDFHIWVQRGHAEKEAGNLLAASDCYERAKGLNGTNADLYLQMGHLFKLRSLLSEAVRSYRTALQLNPLLTDAERELQALGPASATPENSDSRQESPNALPPMSQEISLEVSASELTSENRILELIDAAKNANDAKSAASLQRLIVRNRPMDSDAWIALARYCRLALKDAEAAYCENVAASLKSRCIDNHVQ